MTIAQISDIHCGHPMFDGELLDHAIEEIIELKPDLVVVAGDLTSEGYAPQFRQAKRYLDRLDGLEMVVIPGNHDLMNVGFLHFRDSFGKSDRVVRIPFTSRTGWQPQQVGDGRRHQLVEARPRRGRGRPRQVRLDPQGLRVARRLPHLRAPSPPRADPRHRPRAQHRVGRGRRSGAAHRARGRSRALRPQARAERVAVRRHAADQLAERPPATGSAATPGPRTTSSRSTTENLASFRTTPASARSLRPATSERRTSS